MKKCSIIIPIYNAYDCVIKCLDSVIVNTDNSLYEVICINDKSTDERIGKLLKKYQKDYKKFIKVIENNENLGFVGSVNKGMKSSNTDVLLLNSDTEVTPGWLDRMIDVAYSDESIGTVTPLSNNATLVSVPVGLQRNELPPELSLEEYGEIVNKCAYNEQLELPTAHGFCMFIKRNVLNEIGFFDEKAFGKGYCEETDFSFRCMDFGYKNILCDNVIIYHKEKQSFSEAREKLVKEHEIIINQRYPDYNRRIHTWCQNYPLHHINKCINYSTKLYNRKNILIIIHDWKDNGGNIGGTTLHVMDIIENLRNEYNFHVLTYQSGIYKIFSYFKDGKDEIELGTCESNGRFVKYNRKYYEMLDNIIKAFGIDYIHVHHMINHYFDIGNLIKKYNLKSSITLHDFYSICPTINMLYKNQECCIGKKCNCRECLYYKFGLNQNIIKLWQNTWTKYLEIFDNVIVPSDSTKNIISKVYPNVAIKVIEHGEDIDRYTMDKALTNKQFNIAYVGVCTEHKGGLIFERMIKNNKNKNITYHLFGLNQIGSLNKCNKFINHGEYSREELPTLLYENKINLVCLLSIWPETFSYTLTEVVSAGIPVLSFDIGAISDRIKKNKLGWVIPITNDFNDVTGAINTIVNNQSEYNEVIKNINDYHVKTSYEMSLEYCKIYKCKIVEPDYKALKDLVKNSFKPTSSFNSDDYFRILNSYKWRLVSKIRVPEIIRKLIRKVVK